MSVRTQQWCFGVIREIKRTDAEKYLLGFGAQPLVCDAIKKYFYAVVLEICPNSYIRTELGFDVPHHV